MIQVTRLNREAFIVNCELIEQIEETPNTVLTLTSGKKLVVVETAAEIIQKVIAYRRELYVNLPRMK